MNFNKAVKFMWIIYIATHCSQISVHSDDPNTLHANSECCSIRWATAVNDMCNKKPLFLTQVGELDVNCAEHCNWSHLSEALELIKAIKMEAQINAKVYNQATEAVAPSIEEQLGKVFKNALIRGKMPLALVEAYNDHKMVYSEIFNIPIHLLTLEQPGSNENNAMVNFEKYLDSLCTDKCTTNYPQSKNEMKEERIVIETSSDNKAWSFVTLVKLQTVTSSNKMDQIPLIVRIVYLELPKECPKEPLGYSELMELFLNDQKKCMSNK
ncbi:MAG TPA: hypothetical protein PK747_02085 [Acidobacteriota bacterium]|nr:hypothetical protein [Acidobacteriota bacterium]HQQ46183.1 hypothetical protein [Acidobacteriota bacterium]